MKKYKLLVFGNGGLWSVIKENIDPKKAEVVAFINSDIKLSGHTFEEKPIIVPKDIKDYEFDFIVIASGQYDALLQQLLEFKIARDKVIAFKINESKAFLDIQEEANQRIRKEANHEKLKLITKYNTDPFYLINMNLIGRKRMGENNSDYTDYVRISTLELIANEIAANKVPGNVAELGVYKGDFSKYINKFFPDKKLYLFDTFQGFDSRDVELDINESYSIKTTQFADTNVDLVMNKMTLPDNVIIRKGYFPDTIAGIEDQFAFVSIDTDLYKPIYDGLVYFYPRLVTGGFIFIHDYNNAIFKGAKEAVRKFCAENRIPYVPISDNLGTVVIAK